MAININRINQNTNYNISTPKVERQYSGIKMNQVLQATGNCGDIIPILVREMIPGQKINLNFNTGIQFMPFVTNLMHEINGEILTYFVPYRLIWDEWEDFITGGKDGTFTTELPNINKDNFKIEEGTILDYIGYPVGQTLSKEDEIKLSSFPIRAYNKIYNEQIRNLDIQKEVDIEDVKLKKGQWEFDYFNTARIMQMRGILPTIPLNVEDLKNLQVRSQFYTVDQNVPMIEDTQDISGSYGSPIENLVELEEANNGAWIQPQQDTSAYRQFIQIKNLEKVIESTGINMNNLLSAIGITKYQVNNMRTKPRYMEQLKMRYGVSPTDARLQLPEYIGAKNIEIATNPVTQTAPTTNGIQQGVGEITGQAWGTSQNQIINYMAEEWGIIMSLMIIKPKPTYEIGANSMWTKKTKFDFATPELANMLDVPVYVAELNYDKENRTTKKIFGWRGIYDSYRTAHNIVAKKLRPSVEQNLASYTLAQKLPKEIQLNSDFLECRPDMKRIKQYINQDDFIFYTQTEITTAMPLPLMSDPNEMIL